MNVRWIVVWTTDGGAQEVLPFEEEEDAVDLYERLAIQWSGVLLCRVERDAGRPGGRP